MPPARGWKRTFADPATLWGLEPSEDLPVLFSTFYLLRKEALLACVSRDEPQEVMKCKALCTVAWLGPVGRELICLSFSRPCVLGQIRCKGSKAECVCVCCVRVHVRMHTHAYGRGNSIGIFRLMVQPRGARHGDICLTLGSGPKPPS